LKRALPFSPSSCYYISSKYQVLSVPSLCSEPSLQLLLRYWAFKQASHSPASSLKFPLHSDCRADFGISPFLPSFRSESISIEINLSGHVMSVPRSSPHPSQVFMNPHQANPPKIKMPIMALCHVYFPSTRPHCRPNDIARIVFCYFCPPARPSGLFPPSCYRASSYLDFSHRLFLWRLHFFPQSSKPPMCHTRFELAPLLGYVAVLGRKLRRWSLTAPSDHLFNDLFSPPLQVHLFPFRLNFSPYTSAPLFFSFPFRPVSRGLCCTFV